MYLSHVLLVLLVTTNLKRYFARPRPTKPDYTNESTPNKRTFDFRSRETNMSFPSGDAAQAALFSFMLMNNFKRTFLVLGGPLGFSQFVMAVCFARIYFHCHYLFDVLAGMLCGIVVATVMAKAGAKELLKDLFFKYG